MFNKTIIGTMSVILAGLSLAGCTNSEEKQPKPSDKGAAANFNSTGLPVVPTPITLKMMGPDDMQRSWKDLYFFKGMEEKTNVKFEFTTIPSSSYKERKNLAFASNELPDVFFLGGLDANDEMNYGTQGLLIPLDELIEKYAPTIREILKNNPEIKRSITTPDGHIYALPQVADHPRDRFYRLFINGEWLKNLNTTKLPTTTAELYQLLKDFKEKDPNGNGQADEIPLTGTNKLTYLRPILLSYFGHLSDMVEVSGDKARFVPTQPGYKNYLVFMQKLYREKLLDNEIFSQSNPQMIAKGESGKYGVMGNSLPIFGGKDKQIAPANILDNPQMPPLISEGLSKPIVPEKDVIRRGNFAITNVNKHPEATIRWLDYLYSEDGYKLAQYGIEGQSYKWSSTDPKYIEYIVPQGMLENDFKNNKVSNLGYGYANEALERKFLKPDWLGFVLNDQVKPYLPYAQKAFPLTYFKSEEAQRVNAISVDIRTFVEQMEAKIIVGQEPVEKWDEYVSTMNKMGIDELVKINQAAYDRWKSAK
ncbi:extracellular solute-binding protein [Paenibacillus sp. WQ 127069]|uniref:Extracellular solute-binding protein n=1 Tax=Paenibacillus baimaensis TaxID=2982185 RepID=A0ABT2UC77_9BACL|nr:extracellular solute-binding protein [Paenibacillus sp. WQ 127069]MCU6792226.1 extracellular solute-binding protein [Paenibacillus sp. WQ 127069]